MKISRWKRDIKRDISAIIVVRNETSWWMVIFCHALMSRIVTFFSSLGTAFIHCQRKNFESPPRELQCSDRAQTSTTGSGRPSYVDVVLGFSLSARTKRLVPKQTKISPIYVYIFYQESVEALWYLYTQYHYLINPIPAPCSSSLPPTAHCCTASIYCSCPELLWRFVAYCRQVTFLFAKTSTYDLPVYSSTWVPLKPLWFYSVSFLWYTPE